MFDKYDLVRLQNHPANINQDHLTFCSFFKTEEEFQRLASLLQENIDNF